MPLPAQTRTPVPGAESGGWLDPIGVSIAGRSHIDGGQENQDTFRKAWNADGTALSLIVTDGASSSPRAAAGANMAADQGADVLPRYLARLPASADEWKDLLRRSLSTIRDRLLRDIDGMSADPRAFAATFAMGIVAGDWVGLARVGDGFAAARLGTGETAHHHLVLAPPPPAGEFGGNAKFLTSEDALDHACYRVLYAPSLSGLALSSDGCIESAVIYKAGEPIRPHDAFFDEVFAAADAGGRASGRLTSFLSEGEVAASSGDDKTILAVARWMA